MTELTLSNNRDAFILSKDVPSWLTIQAPDVAVNKSIGTDIAINILITVAVGTPTSVLAAWLYDKFKQCRSHEISINRRIINLREGTVVQIIEETIEVK